MARKAPSMPGLPAESQEEDRQEAGSSWGHGARKGSCRRQGANKKKERENNMLSREEIIRDCLKYLGKPYVWGGESMEEGGYDCSGFVWRVLNDSGMRVGRTTADGYRRLGREIPASQMQPADLLFFGTPARATHIAVYAGDGMMYESIGGSRNTKSNPGKGVTLSSVSRRKDLIEVRTLFGDPAQAPDQGASRNRKHPAVRPVQKYLASLQDRSVGKADGIAGAKFTAAVNAYQKDVLGYRTPDGEITARNNTWKSLLGMP